MPGVLNDFVGYYLTDGKGSPKRFFADKVVAFLSFLMMSFIVIDSFLNLLPVNKGNIICLVNSSIYQDFANAYCSGKVPKVAYLPPLGIFGAALLTVLLHHTWYSTVLYVKMLKDDDNHSEKKKWYRLSCFYIIRNICQFIIAAAPIVLLSLYARNVIGIIRSFDCTTELLDPTLKCIYDSIALNDVFLVFYGTVSCVVIIAAVFGAFDICVRSDLKSICTCPNPPPGQGQNPPPVQGQNPPVQGQNPPVQGQNPHCKCFWKIPSDYCITEYCFPSMNPHLQQPPPPPQQQ